jgi:NOL1/NOP2/sun family putative RNA methylase
MAVIIPNKFRERYGRLAPHSKKFYEYLEKPLKPAIRICTNKISREKLIPRLENAGWKLSEIPFYKDGFVVENASDENRIGLTIEHFLGCFYLQEVASMIPAVALGPKENEVILDLCAAPGSKTSQISQMMDNKGLIIANDNDYNRLGPLKYNIEKCGCLNVGITLQDARFFTKKYLFDRVLLDAPCSSEGQVRKDWSMLSRWSLEFVQGLAGLQKEMISSAYQLLKPKGVLVYSTCTFAPEENEGVVDYLLKKYPDAELQNIDLGDFKTCSGITEFEGKRFNPEVRKCIRVWPHLNDTGGFFVAKIFKSQ